MGRGRKFLGKLRFISAPSGIGGKSSENWENISGGCGRAGCGENNFIMPKEMGQCLAT